MFLLRSCSFNLLMEFLPITTAKYAYIYNWQNSDFFFGLKIFASRWSSLVYYYYMAHRQLVQREILVYYEVGWGGGGGELTLTLTLPTAHLNPYKPTMEGLAPRWRGGGGVERRIIDFEYRCQQGGLISVCHNPNHIFLYDKMKAFLHLMAKNGSSVTF